jgi:hypothetical protein
VQFVEFMQANGHEELAIWTDPAVGLKAFVAIHDTTLGPALGGTRIWPHATDEDAIMDVLQPAGARLGSVIVGACRYREKSSGKCGPVKISLIKSRYLGPNSTIWCRR